MLLSELPLKTIITAAIIRSLLLLRSALSVYYRKKKGTISVPFASLLRLKVTSFEQPLCQIHMLQSEYYGLIPVWIYK